MVREEEREVEGKGRWEIELTFLSRNHDVLLLLVASLIRDELATSKAST